MMDGTKRTLTLFFVLSLFLAFGFAVNISAANFTCNKLMQGEQELSEGEALFVKIIVAREDKVMVRNIGRGAIAVSDLNVEINGASKPCIWTRDQMGSMNTAICALPETCKESQKVKVYFREILSDTTNCVA